jgi:hypothetical protein
MTIELSKFKDRDAVQMNELTDLRQTNAFFERVGFICIALFLGHWILSFRKN